jgi:plasmid stabilization system protein ParE
VTPALRITYSAEAHTDLLSIQNYIAEKDGNARAAMVLGRIEEAIRLLAFMPGIGRTRAYLEPETRAFPVPPWTIIYAPRPDMDGIYVMRVVDGRRDLSMLFEE